MRKTTESTANRQIIGITVTYQLESVSLLRIVEPLRTDNFIAASFIGSARPQPPAESGGDPRQRRQRLVQKIGVTAIGIAAHVHLSQHPGAAAAA